MKTFTGTKHVTAFLTLGSMFEFTLTIPLCEEMYRWGCHGDRIKATKHVEHSLLLHVMQGNSIGFVLTLFLILKLRSMQKLKSTLSELGVVKHVLKVH